MFKIGSRVKLDINRSIEYQKREGVDFNREYTIVDIVKDYAFLNVPIGGKYSNVVHLEYLISIRKIRKEKINKLNVR